MTIGRIWRIGITETMDLDDRKRVFFSNGVYSIVIVLILAYEIATGDILRIFNSPSPLYFTPFFLVALAGMCIGLNAARQYTLSSVLFISFWTFLISILPVVYVGPGKTTYFTHPIYLVVSSTVIHLLFSGKSKVFLFLFLAFSFFLTVFSVDFLLYFDRSPDPQVPLVNSVSTFRANFILIWVFLNSVMAYVMKTNQDFYLSLQEQKDQVRELNDILEHRVEERTMELTERNKVLSDYAFMNAHLLRSPVSRIKGLIHLFSITEDPAEKIKIQQILLETAEDLDKVVRSISEKLNEVK